MVLAPAILRMGANLGRWSRRARFHCSVGGLGVLPYLAQAEACASKGGATIKLLSSNKVLLRFDQLRNLPASQ